MFVRSIRWGLAASAAVLATGCGCHRHCLRQPVAVPTVASAAPGCCPAPSCCPTPAATIPTPVQAYSFPAPCGTGNCR